MGKIRNIWKKVEKCKNWIMGVWKNGSGKNK
jgi:hypothetical protein